MPRLAKNLSLFTDHFDNWLFWSLCILDNHQQSQTLEFTTDGKSLICKSKSKWPCTVSYGTPVSTSANKDDLPATMTLYLRPLKKV